MMSIRALVLAGAVAVSGGMQMRAQMSGPSLTGLVLIWFVYKRRTSGLILAGVAGLVGFAMWKIFVP